MMIILATDLTESGMGIMYYTRFLHAKIK